VCQRLKRAVGNQTRTYSYSSDIKEILVFGDVEAQKQSTEAIEILKRMLELRRKLDDLSYAPCPETGLYAGLEGIKNCGRLHTTERNADTDEITNEFTDNGDPLGGGIVLGYNFRPCHDSIVVGPFGSFDWLETINHTFPGGSFLGTRSN